MGLGKVLGIIFLLLVLIIAVIGVDVYMTYNTLTTTDLNSTFSHPVYDISDDNSKVTISVDISLPSAGFIPKGIDISVTVDFDGDEQTKSDSISLGEDTTLEFVFTLTDAHAQTLANGGSLTVSASADITPTVFGFAIDQVTQTIDLGSQTISAANN